MPDQKNNFSETTVNSDSSEPKERLTDIYQELPRSYKKEYSAIFKTLPLALRKYLHERENEVERGFSKINNELNAKRWIDELFGSRAERLCRHGIKKPREWIEAMAQIDDALDSDPNKALHYLSQLYGVKENISDSQEQSQVFSAMEERLNQLENKLKEITALMKNTRLQDERLEEARKAKDASFSPRGKNSHRDLSDLSTREVLELKMSEYE